MTDMWETVIIGTVASMLFSGLVGYVYRILRIDKEKYVRVDKGLRDKKPKPQKKSAKTEAAEAFDTLSALAFVKGTGLAPPGLSNPMGYGLSSHLGVYEPPLTASLITAREETRRRKLEELSAKQGLHPPKALMFGSEMDRFMDQLEKEKLQALHRQQLKFDSMVKPLDLSQINNQIREITDEEWKIVKKFRQDRALKIGDIMEKTKWRH